MQQVLKLKSQAQNFSSDEFEISNSSESEEFDSFDYFHSSGTSSLSESDENSKRYKRFISINYYPKYAGIRQVEFVEKYKVVPN